MSQTQTHTQIKHKYPDISDTKHKNPHTQTDNTNTYTSNTQHSQIQLISGLWQYDTLLIAKKGNDH